MPALTIPTTPPIVSASTLAGYRVRNVRNEDLGAIEELMIDPISGRLAYAVLCFSGILGAGDKLYAIPWDLLKLNAADRALVLEWDSDLDGAPSFPQDDWPEFGDAQWEREIHEYYGRQPHWYYRAS